MLEMDSFTLNTTTAYDFAIFEINGPSAATEEYNRQQDHPWSIDMITRYEWTL